MPSRAAPMNVSPPAVVVGPPPKLGAPVLIPAGTPSIVPKGICQAMSPVLTLIAVSLPQGGCQQGQPFTDSEPPVRGDASVRATIGPRGRPNNLGDSAAARGWPGAPGS